MKRLIEKKIEVALKKEQTIENAYELVLFNEILEFFRNPLKEKWIDKNKERIKINLPLVLEHPNIYLDNVVYGDFSEESIEFILELDDDLRDSFIEEQELCYNRPITSDAYGKIHPPIMIEGYLTKLQY